MCIDYMPSLESCSTFAASLTLHDSDSKLLYTSESSGSPLRPLREPPCVGASRIAAIRSVHFRSSLRVIPFESSTVTFVYSLMAARIPLTLKLRAAAPLTTPKSARRSSLLVGTFMNGSQQPAGSVGELAAHFSELARQLAMISSMFWSNQF